MCRLADENRKQMTRLGHILTTNTFLEITPAVLRCSIAGAGVSFHSRVPILIPSVGKSVTTTETRKQSGTVSTGKPRLQDSLRTL